LHFIYLLKRKPFTFHCFTFQKVIQVKNYYSLEQTVFNLLRSKRPTMKTEEDVWDYVTRLNAETKKTCDFCHYTTSTAEDIFGRFVSAFCAVFISQEFLAVDAC